MKNIKIAIQKKGRLTKNSINFLHKSGLRFDMSDKALRVKAKNFPLEIFLVRASDIPELLKLNITDLAILGENVIEEKSSDNIQVLKKLDFGKCKICLALPKGASREKVKKVATSYPQIAHRHMKEKFEIIPFAGSVELAPSLGIADAVIDIVETGETLKTHGLKIAETIFHSEAVLAASRESLQDKTKKNLIKKLESFFQAAMLSTNKKYLMMNIPEKVLPHIEKEISSLEAFSIIPLTKKGLIAIHTVIDEDELWDKIDRLKKIGAKGILVFDIEKIFP